MDLLQKIVDLLRALGILPPLPEEPPIEEPPIDETPEEPPEVPPTEPPTEPPVEPKPPVEVPDRVNEQPPFQEDLSKYQLVIDAGKKSASGFGIVTGPGWVRRAEGGLVNGDQYYITRFSENGTERVYWSANIPRAGKYEVWVSYRGSENRTTAAVFVVVDRFGRRHPVTVNQREPGAGGARYKLIGVFSFDKCKAVRDPKKNYVELRNTTRASSESVDAVFLRRQA